MKKYISLTVVLLSSMLITKAQVVIGKENITNNDVLLEFNDERSGFFGLRKGLVLPHVTSLNNNTNRGTLVFHIDDNNNSSLKIKRGLGYWEELSSVNNSTLITTPSYNEPAENAGITISDNNNLMSGVFKITDVNVKVNIEHTKIGDLFMILKSSTGQRALLSYGEGKSGVNYTNTVFDDEANSNIRSGVAPFTGTYIPFYADGLSSFDGENPVQSWTLTVGDDTAGNSGRLLNWAIECCYESVTNPVNKFCSISENNQVSPYFDNNASTPYTSTISFDVGESKGTMLELISNNKAMVLPNVNGVQNYPNPSSGTLVYDTERKALAFFNGKEWSFIIAK